MSDRVPEPLRFRIRNEFAVVELVARRDGPAGRLEVIDVETGNSIVLDALELESLTRVAHDQFGPLILDRFPEEP